MNFKTLLNESKKEKYLILCKPKLQVVSKRDLKKIQKELIIDDVFEYRYKDTIEIKEFSNQKAAEKYLKDKIIKLKNTLLDKCYNKSILDLNAVDKIITPGWDVSNIEIFNLTKEGERKDFALFSEIITAPYLKLKDGRDGANRCGYLIHYYLEKYDENKYYGEKYDNPRSIRLF